MSRIPSLFRSSFLWITALFALNASCAAGISQQDSTQAPTVVAIYAVDTAGALQDVLLYSATDARVTPKFPASYGALRVEFDQPIAGSTLAQPNDLKGTFCSPINADPKQAALRLLDASAPPRARRSTISASPPSCMAPPSSSPAAAAGGCPGPGSSICARRRPTA
jgi:hypothetical protein